MHMEKEIRKGLTWRAGLAMAFSIFIIQPFLIYWTLTTNAPLSFVLVWVVLILWSELSGIFGNPLSKQELFLLLAIQPMTVTFATWFLGPIKNMYFGVDEVVRSFGISEVIPGWWAPPPGVADALFSEKWILLNLNMVWPVIISMISACFWIPMDISMGYICYEIFVKEEKLAFPSATATALTVSTFAERQPDKMRVLLVAAFTGLIYNLLFKFLPWFVGPFLGAVGLSGLAFVQAAGTVSTVIMTPLDLTYLVGPIVPGAGFAFGGDLLFYAPGMLLPLDVAVAQAIGGLGFYFIGTHFITRYNLWPPEVQWNTTWNLGQLVQRSTLYYYVSVLIGLSFAATVVPMIMHPKPLIRALRALSRGGSSSRQSQTSEERIPGLSVLLLTFFGCGIGAVLMNHLLVPDFPIWLLILFIMFGSFFASFVSAISAGVTFSGFALPYQKELLIYYSGYQIRDVWFAPLWQSVGGASLAQNFLQADLCETSKSEYVKAYVLAMVLGILGSFIFISIFWYVSPFPSSAYPATLINWPIDATFWARFQMLIWTGYIFRTDRILIGFVLGTIIYILTDRILHAPYILISIIVGAQLGWIWYPPPGYAGLAEGPIVLSLAQLIGSVLSNKVFARVFGSERWNQIRGLVVLGLIIGDGFMELMRSAIILMAKSMWLLPY